MDVVDKIALYGFLTHSLSFDLQSQVCDDSCSNIKDYYGECFQTDYG
jgi:hypothetical protein